MRDPKRINEIINKIKEIWKQNPDLRFGQFIISNVKEEDLFYIEDDEFLKRLNDFNNKYTV